MDKHPEQEPGEVYLGNSDESGLMRPRWHSGESYDPSGFKASSWKTKRLGRTAYDVDGHVINDSAYHPWFVQRSEVEQAIAASKDDGTRQTLQTLVDTHSA